VRRLLQGAAIGLAGLLILLGSVAGVINRQVLDGPRFADHVDAIRVDPNVSRELGRAITQRVLVLDPDLVAIRPLVESLSISLVASPALRPIVVRAARQLHASLTSPSSGPVVLRLADIGAILTASLRTAAPSLAANLPADFDVTLARVGSASFAERTVHRARWSGLLAWLLPLCGLALVGLVVATSAHRRTIGVRVGFALLATGVVLGSAVLILGIVAGRLEERAGLRPALAAAAWRQLDGPLWWLTVGLVGCAAVVTLVCADLGVRDAGVVGARSWRTLVTPSTPKGLLTRAAAFILAGAALLTRPDLVLRVAAGALGLLLLVLAVTDLLGARSIAKSSGAFRPRRPHAVALALLPPTLAFVALLATNALSADRPITAAVVRPGACNGHAELCDRRYDDVMFPATHNSMTAADENWLLPEQPTGIIGQLDAGIRVFLIDSWYGQSTSRGNVIATAAGSRPAAIKQAGETYGPDLVAAFLRLRDAASLTPTGPRTPYLCHTLCEFGSIRWDTQMTAVQRWLVAHPREVVTFFVQDEVTPADTATVFRTAGLLPFVVTQREGQPWPTLRQMIDSGHRVVVLMEKHGGGAQYPWLLQGFTWVQDTPFANPTVADLSCRRQRGTPDSPILLINHWLGGFRSLVSDAQTVNARSFLLPELRRCERERGQLPNFVAVNYYDHGDLFSVIDELNGIRSRAGPS
jgi:hypothetical protein